MSDDDNPYRFTGGAPEESPSKSRSGRLTLRDLYAIARRRRLLTLFLLVFCSSLGLAAYALIRVPAARVTTYDELNLCKSLTFTAGLGFWVGLLAIFFVASPFAALSDRPFAWLTVLGLIVPGLNVVIAVRSLHDAKRTLESRNVRLGWLTDDFSHADVDRSFWRPSRL